MADVVVDGLEVVEVEEEDGVQADTRSGPSGDRVLEPVEQQVAVGESRQRVVERLAPQFVDEPVVLEGHRRFGGERPAFATCSGVEEVGCAEVASMAPSTRPLATSGIIIIDRWPIEWR